MTASAPLGATVVEDGVWFALAAPSADAVELCLFDIRGETQQQSIALARDAVGIWRGFVAGLKAGAIYGWRVHGPWNPEHGQRFNANKLLLDPYAREVVGRYDGSDIHNGHAPEQPHLADLRDNAATALKARVLADPPPMREPRPQIDPARRVLYETHLKAFTALLPNVPDAERGRYAGLAHPAAINHLKRLGITTVCLMPLAHRADEPRLLAKGLSNHWGYNTIAWAAPETRYASAPESARDECRAMVEALHEAGMEVVLDVVFNHSAESDEFGPTLSLRGIDNALYHHLDPHDPARYVNWAGCGNVLNLNQPLVLRMVMDSLRRWVSDYGIDGFRFDLAPILARGDLAHSDFNPRSAFLLAVAQDPVLCDRLMIAEPWDIGPGGYQLGAFPPGWLEWNDRFRDQQRATWLHRSESLGDLASKMAGSHGLFGDQRPAHSSVNFVTSHDGFTLMDLVSYTHRHNEANGEHNRDGHGHNLSVNHGVEGPSDDPAVVLARLRQRRALIAALLFSLGTPMLLAGDEIGHSQGGNNNAYCQDNPTTWLDWGKADLSLIDFTANAIALRHELVPLWDAHWWRASPDDKGQGALARWWNAHGTQMTESDWAHSPTLALTLQAEAPNGSAVCALLLLNPSAHPQTIDTPIGPWRWRLCTHSGDTTAVELPSRVELPPGALWLAMRP